MNMNALFTVHILLQIVTCFIHTKIWSHYSLLKYKTENNMNTFIPQTMTSTTVPKK